MNLKKQQEANVKRYLRDTSYISRLLLLMHGLGLIESGNNDVFLSGYEVPIFTQTMLEKIKNVAIYAVNIEKLHGK